MKQQNKRNSHPTPAKDMSAMETAERHKQNKRTGEKEVRAMCQELFGRSSFIEDTDGPTAQMMCTLNNERVRRQSCGRVLHGLAMVANEMVGQLPAHTPEGGRFVAATRAFIEAAEWFEREELAVIEATHDVLWEGVLKGKLVEKANAPAVEAVAAGAEVVK